MTEFLADMLEPEEIYRLIVEDFKADGRTVKSPHDLILEAPPKGLGYGIIQAAQAFLDTYVNSTAGQQRYRLPPGDVVQFMHIAPPRTIGHLVYLIGNQQVPQP